MPTPMKKVLEGGHGESIVLWAEETSLPNEQPRRMVLTLAFQDREITRYPKSLMDALHQAFNIESTHTFLISFQLGNEEGGISRTESGLYVFAIGHQQTELNLKEVRTLYNSIADYFC